MRVNSRYQPRPQQTALHLYTDKFRFNVLPIHRRFGKTVWAVNKAYMKLFGCQHPEPRVHYVCPYLKQAKKAAWDYTKYYGTVIPGAKVNNSDLKIDFPGGQRIQLLGADNPDAERGQYSDHVIFDETAQISHVTWREVFRPMLSDRIGSADFIGTPKGSYNLFYDLFSAVPEREQWGRVMLTANDTGIIAPEELERLRQDMADEGDEASFEQEYLCSWNASIKGAFYGKAISAMRTGGRITAVPYDEALPVHTSWDLGMRDSTAVWFLQVVGAQVRGIDYQEWQNTGLPQIAAEIKAKPYQYGEHIGPHDLKVRELGSGMSRLQTAAKLGLRFRVAPNIPIMDGIDATRSMLGRMWIDENRCRHGISALSMYRSEYDEEKRILSSAPVHDWAEHGASGLRYFAVAMRGGNRSMDQLPIDYSNLDRAAV